jgi:oligosaccharide repeat unit polymerase
MRAFARLNNSLLSPLVAFCAAWIFAALLSQYHLLSTQFNWSVVMIVVVAVVPLAFVAGGLVGEGVALRFSENRTKRLEVAASTRLFRRILIVLLLIGLVELAHQFIKIGGIPLLSSQGNSLRFQQGGPTIVLTDLLTVAAIAALVKPRDLLARESRFELVIGITALTGFALQAGRGSIVLPVIAATAARWLYWGRPGVRMLSAAGLLAFAAIVFGFYLRARQNPYNPFEAELYGQTLSNMPFFLYPLVPIYLAITTNFLALQGVVGYFPTASHFGGGAFDALGLNIVFTGARNLSDVSATLTPPWVTSTVAGSLWADGGFGVLVPGITLTGFFSAGAFAMAARTRSFRWCMVAGYLLYLALFGLYTNLWTQEVDWLLVVPLLLALGAVVENPASPPGLTGRAWERIKRMTGRGASDSSAKPLNDGQSNRPERSLARILVLAGLGIAVLLVAAGLAIQPLLPEPYPRVASMRLPQSIARSIAVTTDSDLPNSNAPLQWIEPHGRAVDLRAYQPGQPPHNELRLARIPIPNDPRRVTYDVNYWPPWRALALFSFRQDARHLSITISPTWRSDGNAVHFVAPISAPSKDESRDEIVANWDGSKPDLFVLTRGSPDSQPALQVLSGESGFRKERFSTRLPFRGLAPDTWSVDVGQIAAIPDKSDSRTVKGQRPDLLLVHHDPSKTRSDVQVMLGETGFQWDAFQRDLDTPGSIPRTTEFLLGSYLGATSVYEVQRRGNDGPRLQVFGLEPPQQFK